MRAAVLHQTGQEKLEVHEGVDLPATGAGQVRVRMRAASLCHSDLSAMSGVLPQPAPFVPGHEGAGEITEVGADVKGLAVGDHVVICWMPPDGTCPSCLRGEGNLCLAGFANMGTPNYRYDGADIFGFSGTGTFAEETVVAAGCAVKLPADVPFEVGALIGCGVTTGVGAAIHTAKVEPGSSVVVIGCGGVGIAAIQGARVAGAAQIVAVDPVAARRDWALRFGATEAVAPEGLAAVQQRLTPGGEGFDYAFEVVGRSATVRAAYDATRRGGAVVVVGAGAMDDMAQFNMFELFFNEKRLLPSLYGGADVLRGYRTIIDLWRAGRLDLEGMITHHVRLEGINDAIEQMRTGEALRTVITL